MARQQLSAGQCVEVAGYEIHPELAAAIDAAKLIDFAPAGTRVLWLEQVGSGVQQISPLSQQVLSIWRETGSAPQVRTFEGPPFWQLHERAVAQDAIQATTGWAREVWSGA